MRMSRVTHTNGSCQTHMRLSWEQYNKQVQKPVGTALSRPPRSSHDTSILLYRCIRIHIHICMCMHTHRHIYTIYTHIYTHIYICTHIYADIRMYTYIRIHKHPNIYTLHVHTHAYIRIHTHIHTYIHVCTHVYKHMHTCIHTHTQIHIKCARQVYFDREGGGVSKNTMQNPLLRIRMMQQAYFVAHSCMHGGGGWGEGGEVEKGEASNGDLALVFSSQFWGEVSHMAEVYIYMCTYTYINIHKRMHAYLNTFLGLPDIYDGTRPYIYIHICINIYTYMYTLRVHIYTHIQVCMMGIHILHR